MTTRNDGTYLVKKPEQRRALSSPIRMEILGQFTSLKPMSISEVAGRMGRKPGSLYYHFDMLERVGLLLRAGTRPRGKREESLFKPVAPRFALAVESPGAEVKDVVRTMVHAFRMAERDMEHALVNKTMRPEGDDRNFFATRVHLRTTRDTLAKINRHLQAIEGIILRESGRKRLPKDADQYCSLTLALLPLRGRGRSAED